MHPGIEAFGRFRIDIALADDAAERRLDVRAGAAEAVVKVEMAESGVEVVPPQQADHPPAEPDAFRIAGRAGDRAAGLGELVDLALGFLGGVGRLGRGGLVAVLGVAALGEGVAGSKQQAHAAEQDGETERTRRDMAGPVESAVAVVSRMLSRYLNTDWVRFAACAAPTVGG